MKKPDRNALISLPVMILIGLLFGYAGSQGGRGASFRAGGVKLSAPCGPETKPRWAVRLTTVVSASR